MSAFVRETDTQAVEEASDVGMLENISSEIITVGGVEASSSVIAVESRSGSSLGVPTLVAARVDETIDEATRIVQEIKQVGVESGLSGRGDAYRNLKTGECDAGSGVAGKSTGNSRSLGGGGGTPNRPTIGVQCSLKCCCRFPGRSAEKGEITAPTGPKRSRLSPGGTEGEGVKRGGRRGPRPFRPFETLLKEILLTGVRVLKISHF